MYFQLQEAPSPPKAVFFSCIDSRLQPSAFTSTSPGDMFIGKLNLDHLVLYVKLRLTLYDFFPVRNAGNMVPHKSKLGGQVVSNEAAALDLGCGICGVRHVVRTEVESYHTHYVVSYVPLMIGLKIWLLFHPYLPI